MAKRPLPEPPHKTQIVDQIGVPTPSFQRWLNELYVRIGGKLALNNIELEDQVLAGTDSTAIHVDEAGEISLLTTKTTPVGGDYLIIEDSESSNVKKKILISAISTGSAYEGDIDGGFPSDVYLVNQLVDGGAP